MNEAIKYVVPGDPIALARHRMSNGRAWDEQKQIKLGMGLLISNQHGNRPLYNGKLQMDITFFMPIPKKGAKSLNGTYHYIRPDLDNMVKMCFDVCNGLLYRDDCVICELHACKRYDRNPRTEFTIVEIK